MTLENAYHTLYTLTLICLSVLTLLCLFRAIRGPRIADRVVSINMICTMTLCMICILAMMLGEGYLADVALIYALLGFLAVVVLCKVYMGVALEHREQRKQEAQQEAKQEVSTDA
ncbi:MAG: monovalent cation/H+ antiporter complex subunit F [Clostridia bacterium]